MLNNRVFSFFLLQNSFASAYPSVGTEEAEAQTKILANQFSFPGRARTSAAVSRYRKKQNLIALFACTRFIRVLT